MMSERSLQWLALVVFGLSAPALSIAADFTADQVRSMLANAGSHQPVDLSGSDLSDLDLSNIDFKRADLSRANLFASRLDLSGSRGREGGRWITALDHILPLTKPRPTRPVRTAASGA